MSEEVIHEEHALRAGWFAIAGVCAVLAIAPDTELAFWARALILLLGASSLLIGLTRRSRSVWLDEDSGVLLVRQSSVFGTSERRVALSDINAIECIMVSAGTGEYDNGYQSRLTLKSGEHFFLTRSSRVVSCQLRHLRAHRSKLRGSPGRKPPPSTTNGDQRNGIDQVEHKTSDRPPFLCYRATAAPRTQPLVNSPHGQIQAKSSAEEKTTG